MVADVRGAYSCAGRRELRRDRARTREVSTGLRCSCSNYRSLSASACRDLISAASWNEPAGAQQQKQRDSSDVIVIGDSGGTSDKDKEEDEEVGVEVVGVEEEQREEGVASRRSAKRRRSGSSTSSGGNNDVGQTPPSPCAVSGSP